ncbi:very short patch repair endonuclease [Azospirillum sp. A29]|uniref:very short patch repair endonuclease n=1 Tax=Azospirillum sp. A29 TaxID=3160606 RepID=UPI00366D8B25
MADRLTEEQRRLNMSRIRGRDTKPEFVVRRLLHGLGFRYRLHGTDLPGRPDIVLPKWKTVVFVNGCFWHGHGCRLFKWPATREEFWRHKIGRNVERDAETRRKLDELEWRVVNVWECALKGSERLRPEELGERLTSFIRSEERCMDIVGTSG